MTRVGTTVQVDQGICLNIPLLLIWLVEKYFLIFRGGGLRKYMIFEKLENPPLRMIEKIHSPI